MKKAIVIVTLLFTLQQLNAQKSLELYEKREFISGKDTLRYRILYPEERKEGKAYPLIVFLHGSGERGRNNEAQLVHGGEFFAREAIMRYFPAIVIFPQCPPDSTWSRFKRNKDQQGKESLVTLSEEAPPVPQRLVKELMDSLLYHHIVDAKRIYIGGLSLGGFGTYDMLTRYPDYFAAAFSICGASNVPLMLKKAKKIPLWIFHGALDNVVPPQSDRELYKAMMTSGAREVIYTEYPDLNHNSWDAAFAEPRLLPWLFSNKKKHKTIK